MKLIGFPASPFARRIRLFLNKRDYEFLNINIFSKEGRKVLTDNNPAQKVPALVDEGQTIYDSRVIYRYLAKKFEYDELSWSQENLLTLIDAANDSFVSLLLLKRSEIDTSEDKLFFNLQRERVLTLLDVLNKEVKNGTFNEWHYPSICLYCLLDWIEYRELADLQPYQYLISFIEESKKQDCVNETDPRLAE